MVCPPSPELIPRGMVEGCPAGLSWEGFRFDAVTLLIAIV
jgi:hypothetical protein